jgi:hypothetical protein
MRKFDIIILVVLMVLSAVNSFGAVLSTSSPEQKAFFSACLVNPNSPCSTPVDVFYQGLITEVSADLEREALLAGKSKDSYLSTDAPFTKTLEALNSDEIKNMDRVDVGISIVKLGMRYYFIKNTRFVAPHFFENEAEFRRLVRELSSQHNLPFQL